MFGIDDRDRVAVHADASVTASLTEREDRDRDRRGEHTDQGRARIHAATFSLELDVEGLELRELALQSFDDELVEALRLVDVLQPTLAEIPDRDPDGRSSSASSFVVEDSST